MYPSGTIYKAKNANFGKSGEVALHAPFRIKLIFSMLRSFGATLTLIPVIFVFYSFAPVVKEEVVYSASQVVSPPQEVQKEKVVPKQDVAATANSYGVNSEFSIVVPKINATSNVVSNVDVTKESEYERALKEGVAHAKDTGFPGQGKLIFLFSHSTASPLDAARYSAIFYLLHHLEKGDKIIVFYQNKEYEYLVDTKLVVKPSEVGWLKDRGEGEVLILQTCTPPGTNFKRLLVIAKPVGKNVNQKYGKSKFFS